MAGAGTGLPGSRGDVATTPANMNSMGAAAEASADALFRIQRGFQNLVDAIEPAAQQAAQTLAEQDVQAGQFRQRAAITGADVAYNRAMREGTLARLGNARDNDLDQMRLEHAFDPEAFQKAASEYRSSSLNAAVPAALAVDWAADFDRRSQSILSTIRTARANRDLEESKGALTARRERLVKDMVESAGGRDLAQVLSDPLTASALAELGTVHDELSANLAFGISTEESDAMRASDLARVKAGAVSSGLLSVLRTQGADAALAGLQTLLTDDSLPLDKAERQLAFNVARDAVQQEIGLSNQRRNQQEAAQAQAEREVGRLIDEDVARMEATGQGSGLTEDHVRSVGGDAAVMRWYKARAQAVEFHNLVGNLPLNDPDAAAAQISTALSRRQTLGNLSVVQDAGDLQTLKNAIIQVETGGRNGLISADPDGGGPAGGGAFGIMQVLPDTARRMAQKLGVPFDANRLRTDRAYNEQIGTAYLSELLDRYGGDTFLAVTAYHAGEGNVDGWLKSVGDPRSGALTREAWLDGVERRGNPRSAAYPRKVLAALGAGQAQTAWDTYQGRRQIQQTDPAVTVQGDFAVKGARDRWMAQPNSVPAAEAYVQANIDAQDRQRIQQGNRRTLTVELLAIYAGDLTAFERAGDSDGFQSYLQRVGRQFGKHGQRVVQDILEVRGDTRFAAQVQARASRQAAQGFRPSRAEVEQANTAGRAEQASRAATGATVDRNVRTMSDADILAAAGLN
ncbi:transglycosylase SLT domain-containing protein [Brevundimonas diminuta]|uniref:transglycosylase SLT domain-containing protein n=1 Tax=Brevundimonas diminuta TaxID=293 RepID=UPI003D9A98F7